MMDCKQLRDVLDCYNDQELSAEAMAAADAHLRECAACTRAAAQLRALRQSMRRAAAAWDPPPDLERRVRAAIWPGRAAGLASAPRWVLAVAAAAILAVAAAGAFSRPRVEAAAIAVVDQAVVRFADVRQVVLDARVLCRDCELHERYGERATCERTGHRGAIATSDGRIWNIIEQPSSAELIHDKTLLGKKVRVRGRMFRAAGTIAIDAYEIL